MKHLIIPDAHVIPKTNNDRFEMAGTLALDERPDVIVCLGDFADMASLCSYDKNRRSFEGRRYILDCEAARDALSRFNKPIDSYNRQRRRNGKAQYKPRKVMLLGNHEHRITRATDLSPELEGTLDLNDLGYKEYGWEVQPFLMPIEINGVYYNHYFVTGVSGEAISGLNIASSILAKQLASCTAGHIHLLDFAIRSSPSGKQSMALVPGCFFEHKFQYSEAIEYLWWRGLAIKHNVVDGAYDLELISLKQLKHKYGE